MSSPAGNRGPRKSYCFWLDVKLTEVQGFFGTESPTRLRMFEPRICESKGLRHSGFFDSDVFDSEMGKATGEHKKLGRGVVAVVFQAAPQSCWVGQPHDMVTRSPLNSKDKSDAADFGRSCREHQAGPFRRQQGGTPRPCLPQLCAPPCSPQGFASA